MSKCDNNFGEVSVHLFSKLKCTALDDKESLIIDTGSKESERFSCFVFFLYSANVGGGGAFFTAEKESLEGNKK